jgi:hypothetical protein
MKRPNIYAKHALLEMHASLAGKIAEEQRALLKDRKGMRAIESVFKMMDPDFKINRIAVRRQWANN